MYLRSSFHRGGGTNHVTERLENPASLQATPTFPLLIGWAASNSVFSILSSSSIPLFVYAASQSVNECVSTHTVFLSLSLSTVFPFSPLRSRQSAKPPEGRCCTATLTLEATDHLQVRLPLLSRFKLGQKDSALQPRRKPQSGAEGGGWLV